MKVKKLIKLLLACNPDYDAAYEHCHIDYCNQHDSEKLVEMGDCRPLGYSRWIPLSKREPDDSELPCLIAMKDVEDQWQYYISTDFFMGLGTAAKRGAMWMPIERTHEDKYRRLGYDDETVKKILELEEKDGR